MRPKPTITWTSSSWFEQSLILGHCIPFQNHSKINSEFCREIMLHFYFLLDTQTNFVLELQRLETGRIMLPCSHWRRPPWHLLDTAKTGFQCLGMVDVSKDSPLDELYPQNFMVLAPFCNIHLCYPPMIHGWFHHVLISCWLSPKLGGLFFPNPNRAHPTNPSSLGLWVRDGLQTSLLSMTNVVTFLPMACWVLHQLTHTHISCLTRDQNMLCCIVVGELILLMILIQMFAFTIFWTISFKYIGECKCSQMLFQSNGFSWASTIPIVYDELPTLSV
jgi:hypothetical protein